MGRAAFIQLAHDKLATDWARLHKWISEDTAYALQHSVGVAQRGYEAGVSCGPSTRAEHRPRRRCADRSTALVAPNAILSGETSEGSSVCGAAACVLLLMVAGLSLWLLRELRTAAQLRKDKGLSERAKKRSASSSSRPLSSAAERCCSRAKNQARLCCGCIALWPKAAPMLRYPTYCRALATVLARHMQS